MCWYIMTLDYLCGHEIHPNHGIPDQFIRECDRSTNVLFNRCQAVHSRFLQERIPWLCPDCHWSIINRGLGPLYASTIQTGQSTINSLADRMREDQSLGVLALSNQLRRTIQQTQESVLTSGDIFPAQALNDFLGAVKFKVLRDEAQNIDHPWRTSLSDAPQIHSKG
jgi:hypothetical protein